jgi:hypothetical protein
MLRCLSLLLAVFLALSGSSTGATLMLLATPARQSSYRLGCITRC